MNSDRACYNMINTFLVIEYIQKLIKNNMIYFIVTLQKWEGFQPGGLLAGRDFSLPCKNERAFSREGFCPTTQHDSLLFAL